MRTSSRRSPAPRKQRRRGMPDSPPVAPPRTRAEQISFLRAAARVDRLTALHVLARLRDRDDIASVRNGGADFAGALATAVGLDSALSLILALMEIAKPVPPALALRLFEQGWYDEARARLDGVRRQLAVFRRTHPEWRRRR